MYQYLIYSQKPHSFWDQAKPAKSTLSNANRKRSLVFFQQFYFRLYIHYRTDLTRNWLDIGAEVKPGKVEELDATFSKQSWRVSHGTPWRGKKKGGTKVFTQMNLPEGVPNFRCIRSSATNENLFLKVMQLVQYSIAVFDKRKNRYSYFDQWCRINIKPKMKAHTYT